MNKIFQFITFGLYKEVKNMKTKQKDNFFTRLLKEDNNLSVLNFFLIVVLAVGIILLFVPVIGMLVDIFYNHTMTINLSDMAMYIGAVAAIFASGGLTSAWTEFSYSKYDIPPVDEDGNDMVIEGGQSTRRRYRKSLKSDKQIDNKEINSEE